MSTTHDDAPAATLDASPAPAPALGDMPPEEFRRHAHALVDWMADYLANVEQYPVLAEVEPGEIAARVPASPPARGEDFAEVLADAERVVIPGITHWNHPGFHAYFAITGSAPGILGEADRRLFGAEADVGAAEAVERYRPYIARELAAGTHLAAMTRHMLGLFHGAPGARTWRRILTVESVKPGAGLEKLDSITEPGSLPKGDGPLPPGLKPIRD